MAKWHLPLALPLNTLFGFTLIAVLAGVGAAVMPARRASRLNVLEALQYEYPEGRDAPAALVAAGAFPRSSGDRGRGGRGSSPCAAGRRP
jgi:hypothetical protein